jgi:hypothetical protein
MFALIITIICIALVAALVIAALWYGAGSGHWRTLIPRIPKRHTLRTFAVETDERYTRFA